MKGLHYLKSFSNNLWHSLIDSTKQAAIMLMTRHTPKSKPPSPKRGSKGPSYVVKKPSPVNKKNKTSNGNQTPKATPKRSSTNSQNQSTRSQGYASVIEIPDSAIKSSITRRSANSSMSSPVLATTKKSALKNPSAKMGSRKTESIKFDLSNLENNSHNRSSDVMLVTETSRNESNSDESTDITLRYSESPTSKSDSQSPRRALMSSRSNRILEKSLGTSSILEYSKSERRSLPIESPRSKKSLRGSIILKNALDSLDATDIPTSSRKATKSLSDQSWGAATATSRLTRTLSPRASRNNLESYSIVDLVSFNSNESISSRSGSVYNSAGSVSSYTTYDTPTLGSSTPYELRKTSTPDLEITSTRSRRHTSLLPKSRLSKQNSLPSNSIVTSNSVTTPENNEDTTKNITFNSTRISRATKSRSRINDSDIQLIEGEEEDSSPKSSKRINKSLNASPLTRKNTSLTRTPSDSPSTAGNHTPENRRSPEEASTPMLRIQSLLNASQQSINKSPKPVSKSRKSNLKRKTIGVLRSGPRRGRTVEKSKSLNVGRSLKGRDISANFDESDDGAQNDEEVITPKSAVKLVQEAVKNKHSTAKKPQSKRSLIDDLNESDIVKTLFNSPVKRKLSQSMTEFSRKKLFEDDERPTRSTRSTIAAFGKTPDTSLMNHTEQFSPEVFVSPLNTPNNSPNMTGIKRLFQKNTPNNDLRNVRGVKGLLRTPRNRKSNNDLRNVSGVKNVFARSPRNRLSDVRIKNVFAASPKNDLRRITGVKALFGSDKKKRRSPRNALDDVRGVRNLFHQNSPKNLRQNQPKNDLSDVRGVKRLFRQEKQQNELSDVSGVEQLFHESGNYDSTFDQLLGRPPIRAVYTKSKSFTANKVEKKKNTKLKSKSLHDSISQITTNVEEWLENELRKRVRTDVASEASTTRGKKSTPNKSKNTSKINLIRELQKLSTDTVDGSIPVITSRTRNSSILKNEQSDLSRKKSASEVYSAHTLPIKKRSLVEASINKSSNDRSNKLPIKKRAVVHSTPVKGRVNMTMNASEIGRMSPISSEDKITEIGAIMRSSAQPQASPKTKVQPSKAKSNADSDLKEKSTRSPKQSPKKTRLTKAAQSSPAVVRATRGRKSKIDNQEVLNVKKRRSSIVITKKAPILSPKPPTPRITRRGKSNAKPEPQNVPKVSPKKTRTTRGQKSQVSVEVKAATPKSTRTKVRRTSVIVVKRSPKLNPQATRNTKHNDENTIRSNEKPQQTRGQRKTKITEPESKETNKRKMAESLKEPQIELEPARKTRKTNTVQEPKGRGRKTNVDKSVSIVQTRRSQKVSGSESTQNSTNNTQGRRTRKVTETKEEEQTTNKVTKRGKKIQPQVSEDPEPKRRGRSTKAEETVVPEVGTTKRKGRTTVLEKEAPKTTGRGRSNKTQAISTEANKKNAKVTEDPVPEATGRGRKRKTTEQEDTPTKNKTETTKQTRSAKSAKGEDKQTKSGNEELKSTRSKKGSGDATNAKNTQENTAKAVVAETRRKTRNTAQKEVEVKPARGRKVAAVVESAPPEGGRKKRTITEISDAKEKKKEPAKKPRAASRVVQPEPAGRGGRARRR